MTERELRDRSDETGLVDLVEDQTGLRIDSLTNDAVTLTNPATDDLSLEHSDLTEPSNKRIRLDSHNADLNNYLSSESVKTFLSELHKSCYSRLDDIEQKLQTIATQLVSLETKMDDVLNTVHIINLKTDMDRDLATMGKRGSRKPNVVIVGMPQSKRPGQDGDVASTSYGQNVTLITLNSEEDYPDGSWIGDENNPEMRVRVPISPSALLHINTNCLSAEKMALTLLDYLFDRETQAMSNLSGMGRYNKKQLDPLFIYAIRCHLVHHFGITESDWHRIKQNLDSKCRTAFRRKQRGMHMAVKSFRGRHGDTEENIDLMRVMDDSLEMDDVSDKSVSSASERQPTFDETSSRDKLIKGGANEIQVLHATPEQLAQLQHAQHIEILQAGHVVGHLNRHGEDRFHMAISMLSPDQLHIQSMKTASGDIMHLDAASIVPISASELTAQLGTDVSDVMSNDSLHHLD